MNKYIIGVDECGMGCNAGGLFACALKAPIDWSLDGLNDSKKLTKLRRAKLTNILIELADKEKISWKISMRDNQQIDLLGLAACHKSACAESINYLWTGQEDVVIDGNLNPMLFINHGLNTNITKIKSVVKADSKYPTVMAASIIAKHMKDVQMIEYHELYPCYDWINNSGYIVPRHVEAIKKYGLSPLHRKSYKLKLN